MLSVQTQGQKERLSFFISAELSEKVSTLSKRVNLTISDIARRALQNYINQMEKEIIDKELEAGYKANYDYYAKSQSEWQYADKG